MQKFAKKLSVLMVALMTIMTVASYMPAKAATVVPKVQFVGEQKLEYKAGERITFNLNAANYGGRVQYRVVLWNDNTKSYKDLWNTGDKYYANWMPYGNETLPLTWIINEPGSYRITVYTKRAGLANSKTANPGANCDSFAAGPAFVIKAAVTAEDKVAAYEKAALVTADDIVKAEALAKEAVAEVAKVTNETDKAAFTARIEAQDKKLEEAKYVHVKEVLAIDKNTLKITFNKEVVGNVKNFKIYEKDNQYVTMLVKEVKVDKEVAMVTLYNDLATKTAYVIEVSGAATADAKFAMKEAETKEFTFVKATPATITFASTKVLVGKTIGYVVKDANGNDISANYPLSTLTIQVANTTYVDGSLLTKTVGATIVNLLITGTEIQTGNTIIDVVAAAPAVLASLGRYSLGNTTYADPTVNMYKPTSGIVTAKLNYELLKANGEGFELPTGDTLEYIYSSSNPTVALVNSDGLVSALSEGTAYITVIVTQKNSAKVVVARVPKQYAVTVKADKTETSLKIDKTYVKVVLPETGVTKLTEVITITVLDQYGNTFDGANDTLKVVYNDDKDTSTVATASVLEVKEGVAKVVVTPGSTAGTVKMTFAYNTLPKVSATAEAVAAAAFNGYVAEIGATTLDHYAGKDYTKGATSTTVRVFRKDVNGNKIEEISVGVGSNLFQIVKADANKEAVAVTTTNAAITVNKTGTETLYVKVNGMIIQTFNVTVVNSKPVLTKITQTTEAFAFDKTETLVNQLFGKYDATAKAYDPKGIFVGYDQYGKEIAITSYKLYSNNISVINTDKGVLLSEPSATADTKVLLIVEVNGEFKQVEILVRK